MKALRFILLAVAAPLLVSYASAASIAENVVREKVAGIDLLAYKTGVHDVVTIRGSFPAGDSFAANGNVAVPTLVGGMLDKGTTQQDKYAIAQKLDAIGAKIHFAVTGVMLDFSGKCLRKDLPSVISILAEELRTPAFSETEFAKLKRQMVGNLQRAMESTDYRAGQAFAETVFPVGHPNYAPPTKDFIAAIQSATLDDLKKFHSEYYGPAQATIVAVGDVDMDALKPEIAKSFDGWTGGKTVPDFPKVTPPEKRREETIQMADKPSVSVLIGGSDGMRYTDPDALALRVATAALGRGFTGRLMATVRDKEGLTYGISAGIGNDSFASGEWQIDANFAPQLLEKGVASTERELEKWYASGISAAELERVKTNLVGTFKVGLATSDGMASTLIEAIHRGLGPEWLDQYPERIANLSLADVNAAIKKHLQPGKMTVIEAGSVPPPQHRG